MAVRVGLAGTGYWAEEIHLPTLASCDGVELVGIWGRNDQRTRSLGGDVRREAVRTVRGHDRGGRRRGRLRSRPKPSRSSRLRAARAGKHLFLEKPLATVDRGRGRGSSRPSMPPASPRSSSSCGGSSRSGDRRSSRCSGEAWQSCRVRMLSATIAPGSPYVEFGLEKRRGRGVVGYRAARPVHPVSDPGCGAQRLGDAPRPHGLLHHRACGRCSAERRAFASCRCEGRGRRDTYSRARTARRSCRLSCSRASPAATRARVRSMRAAGEHRDGRAPAPLRRAFRRARRARPGRGRAKHRDRQADRASLIGLFGRRSGSARRPRRPPRTRPCAQPDRRSAPAKSRARPGSRACARRPSGP